MKNTTFVPVSKQLKMNVDFAHEYLGVDKSFDVIQLDMLYANKKMTFFMIDGFVKDDILHYLLSYLSQLKPEQLEGNTLDKLIHTYIPYVEVSTNKNLKAACNNVLAGPTLLLVDGVDDAILIDARTYPVRGPQEPDIERVVRGARDGFVETLVFNTALTRRRVRDRSLRMEYLQVGRRSQTDIVISYIEDIVDMNTVTLLKENLAKIDTDGIPMAEKTIEEFLAGRHINPYPIVRYTERPDTTASHLYDGHICIFVDGSPSVIITPVTFWHHLQHAEEYRNSPIVGAYLRAVRYIAVLTSLFLLPLWYLMILNPDLLPASLSFLNYGNKAMIPLLLQLFLVEIGIDMLRMAAIHTPSALATALGLVAAIMIGGVAVEVGVLSNEVILYLSISAIGTFATPSYELGLANRIVRLLFLIATALFQHSGLVIGVTIWLIGLVTYKSFNVPYMWPFIPFSYRAFRDVLLRIPIPLKNRRPTVLNPRDPDR